MVVGGSNRFLDAILEVAIARDFFRYLIEKIISGEFEALFKRINIGFRDWGVGVSIVNDSSIML